MLKPNDWLVLVERALRILLLILFRLVELVELVELVRRCHNAAAHSPWLDYLVGLLEAKSTGLRSHRKSEDFSVYRAANSHPLSARE